MTGAIAVVMAQDYPTELTSHVRLLTDTHGGRSGGVAVSLSEVEKLIRFVMNPGISNADLCKFLVLETFAHSKTSALYIAEITEDGYIAPLGTFGIPAQVVAGWGNISLSVDAPFTDAVKTDKVILLKREDSLQKYPSLANYDGIPQKWDSYLVCPILPHGLIALTLDSTPKVDHQFDLFLRTVGAIVMHHFKRHHSTFQNGNNGHRDSSAKKSGVLTNRQITILNLMEKGLSNPAIAEQIGYSESLVRQETMSIYSTLNVSGRKELIERKKE
jgi:DNA-binding CsgD family transcriptional regulator